MNRLAQIFKTCAPTTGGPHAHHLEPTAAAQASTVFSKALDAENDNLLSAQLVHIEKTQGRKLPYYQMALMAKAKQLADVLGDETFDAAAAAPRLEARANA